MAGRIVVGVDCSPCSLNALRWAVDEARRDDDIDLVQAVMVWQIPYAVYLPAIGVASRQETQLDIEHELDQTLAAHGLTTEAVGGANHRPRVERIVVQGRTADSLLDVADGAAMLVVGARGRGEFVGMLLGSVSLHCVSHATCPVVVIPPETT